MDSRFISLTRNLHINANHIIGLEPDEEMLTVITNPSKGIFHSYTLILESPAAVQKKIDEIINAIN